MRGVIGGRAVDGSKVTGAITDVDTVGSSLSTVQVAVDRLALGAAATGHQSVRIHGLDVAGEGLAPAGVSGVHLGDGLLDGTGDKLAGAVGFVGVDWERPLDFDDGVAGNGGSAAPWTSWVRRAPTAKNVLVSMMMELGKSLVVVGDGLQAQRVP